MARVGVQGACDKGSTWISIFHYLLSPHDVMQLLDLLLVCVSVQCRNQNHTYSGGAVLIARRNY